MTTEGRAIAPIEYRIHQAMAEFVDRHGVEVEEIYLPKEMWAEILRDRVRGAGSIGTHRKILGADVVVLGSPCDGMVRLFGRRDKHSHWLCTVIQFERTPATDTGRIAGEPSRYWQPPTTDAGHIPDADPRPAEERAIAIADELKALSAPEMMPVLFGLLDMCYKAAHPSRFRKADLYAMLPGWLHQLIREEARRAGQDARALERFKVGRDSEVPK